MKDKVLDTKDYNHIDYINNDLIKEDIFKDKLNKNGQLEDEGSPEDEI